ncbi:tyrosine-type recombinase/integrase [Alkalibacterium iburiense]|uniref:Tyrosine-type recombinase/integrase n=1 Tax=Alkalibacterium iburiense TaxID=290589 RepID=A0ABN0X5Y7_9LACT
MKFEKYTTYTGKSLWKFYHYLGTDPDTGKANEIRRRGFKTQSEARENLLEIIKEYEKGENVKLSKKDKYSFQEVTELWLLHYEKQVKVTTFTTANIYLDKHILPLFKNFFIDKIDVRRCQDAVNRWYSTYSEAALLVSIVNRIFKFAINQGFCIDNPMSKIIRPKNTHKQNYVAPFYEKHELLSFLKALKEDESLKAYTMFHLLAFTGLRRGEVFGLKWKDIDFEKMMLSVNRTLIYNQQIKQFQFSTPKTKNSVRQIGIDNKTIKVLLQWRNFQREFFIARGLNVNSSEQLVFTSENNHYMTDAYLRRIIKRITTKHNLPHITVHGFRHTHCSLLFEAGIEMNNVKDRLGHSNIKTTMNIYAHVTKTERDKTADLFSDFMERSM